MIHTQLFLTIIDQKILYLHSFIYSKNSYWENKQKNIPNFTIFADKSSYYSTQPPPPKQTSSK